MRFRTHAEVKRKNRKALEYIRKLERLKKPEFNNVAIHSGQIIHTDGISICNNSDTTIYLGFDKKYYIQGVNEEL